MYHKLSKEDYPQVAELFAPLAAFNLIISAGLDGNNACEIFVDQVEKPDAAFMNTVEGTYLVGKANPRFIAALHDYLQNIYFVDEDALYLCISDTCLADMDRLFTSYDYEIDKRQHYLCTGVRYDWRAQIPEGYTVSPIDEQLLNNPNLEIPQHIFNWIRYNWDTQSNFFKEGFGFCTQFGNQVVSWSIADCKSGTHCEIGIRTHEDYRQRGLAAITAAACTDYALHHGFTHVGWHCSADNIGSWKTAQKVGFIKERDYQQYVCYRSAT